MDDSTLMAACTTSMGFFALWASLTNHEGLFTLRSVAFLERRLGRPGARTAIAAMGTALLLMAASYWVWP